MFKRFCVTLLGIVLIAGMARSGRSAGITAEQVRAAIDKAVEYLKKQQNRERGNWAEYLGQPGGVTSLCTLALLNSGVPVDDPVIQKSLAYLRGLGKPDKVYSTALQTMVFCAATPEKDRYLISRNVRWLENAQIDEADALRRGTWTYSETGGNGDNSNTQFALLALYEADRVGVKVNPRTWRLSHAYWEDCQKEDGSWGYVEDQPSTGSMTCAGITSMIITSDRLSQGDATVSGDTIQCCGEQETVKPIEDALTWMGNHFSVERNPSGTSGIGGAVGSDSLLYYLYGLERVGRLSGRRFFIETRRTGGTDRHDWYRRGAEYLVAGPGRPDSLLGFWKGDGRVENNPIIATPLALLFLAKGRRPVLVSQYKHRDDNDWNLHRHGLHNLTRHVEKAWKKDLTWQTVDARAATAVDDLLQTPVLFISGEQSLRLTAPQKELLRQYVDQGGFIFAEACNGETCDGEAFDAAFRALMAEIFPDSQLQKLPADHPIWFAETKIDPDYLRPLYGIDACCRTSVVYCPQNLSCLWELAQGRDVKYSDKAQAQIDAGLAIGQNVLAYATNRELKEKLRPIIAADTAPGQLGRNALYVPKLSHGGGADDAPNALRNLLRVAGQQIDLTINQQSHLIAAGDPKLRDYPIAFMHGRREFQFDDAGRSALAKFFERGGFLFADSICASDPFAKAFRRELKMILPKSEFELLPADDPLLSREFGGFDLSSVTLRDPLGRAPDDPLRARLVKTAPRLEVLKLDGRIAVVFSPYDISCALENHASLECKSYIKEDAARIGVNVILYALQQ